VNLPALFAARLLDWFDRHGRHDLPWQHPRSAYRAWIAEIMLQQTQVATVIPYFQRFVQAFPDLPALAAAGDDEVLAHWSGLGYYSRARNLHAAARRCVEQHGGALPQDIEAIAALPGIGRSTAAAILAQAHGQRHAILDGNVKRVLCRLFAVEGWPGSAAVEKRLWPLAEALLPDDRLADYTQAIMDFGAGQCRRSRPDCAACPFREDCLARQRDRVGELPSPRPGKRLPERTCVMLMLRDPRGRLLLQRRPPVGIWGGLWSLPQFDDAAAARAWTDPLGADPASWSALPEVAHVFSHFRLRITPLRASIDAVDARVADNPDSRWLAKPALAALGLPAPVRRMLASLPTHEDSPDR